MAEALADVRITAIVPLELPKPDPLRLVWTGGAAKIAGVVSIGAHGDNQVALVDPFVSSFHCSIEDARGRLLVKDLRSTNGTFVDGMRISEAELCEGSRLRVGECELRVERDSKKEPPQLPGLVVRDPALSPVLELLKRAAPSKLPITILGESGTGKEVAARAVHELSDRSRGPFVPVNCGAIAHELAEAELFGHEKGAFTGAVGSTPGAFGAADSGTLFLDEIGDLPLQLQVKLLRALEAGEVKPVGAARPRPIDVRVVCATHQDLAKRVREGSFREDLFYRLRGVTVELPPLRARPRDVVPLAEHFLPATFSLSPDARTALSAYRWPGNVRELRHVIHLAAVLSDGPVIRAAALHFDGQPAGVWDTARAAEAIEDEVFDFRGRSLEQLEEMAIRSSLLRHGGNRRAVSAELGIARSSLLRKLDQLGLRSKDA
ncbi:MAG TPA: sigma 54-interacting transcriptional regulator [Myxococcales bacterium]|jgi:DNA-binding NtrC family response regulator